MIVIGIDPHMKTHTAIALDGAKGTGAQLMRYIVRRRPWAPRA